ncbi:MAG: NifB/NifX family molybdenum-iron cluster-binding protein [Candidatus Micrarchaeia archaeon]
MDNWIIMATVDMSGMLTGLGRAPRVEIIYIKNDKVEKINEIDVKWDESHEKEQEGLHHAAVAKFIMNNKINEVITAGAGPDMHRMLERLGVKIKLANGYYKEYI